MNKLLFSLFLMLFGMQENRITVRGLESLYALPAGSHIGYCDLSHLQLQAMPNLSMYHIDTLDISHNSIRRVDNALLLPQGLIVLDMSHNDMAFVRRKPPTSPTAEDEPERFVGFYPELFPKLERLDISYNRIRHLRLPPQIRHVNAEHCTLRTIRLCLPYDEPNRLTYLNLNDNPDLYGIVNFDVNTIDTLLTKNCAKGLQVIKAPDE